MKYGFESKRSLAKSKASSSAAHRSAASAIVSLFVGLVIIRVGMLQFSSAAEQGDLARMVAETGVLLDVSERIGQVLVPFGTGSSAEIEKIAWADGLMAEQERLESRIRPAKVKGVTAWGRELVELQDRLKARMEQILPTSVHALLLQTSSESQSNISSQPFDNQKHELASAMTEDEPQMKDIPGALQAEIEHTKRIVELESRKVGRQQTRLEKRKFAKATEDSFAKFFQVRKKAQAQRRKERTWARGLPGASQACSEHEQRMQELEARKVVRQQFRLEKRASAQEAGDSISSLKDIPGALQAEIEHTKRIVELESRKAAREQTRLEKRKFAKATEDSFAKFFQVRKKEQAQRRKERTWARGLPGASQAYGEHEQRMQELKARKVVRQQHRSEKQVVAQATKDGFEEFFQERKLSQAVMRESRKWAHNLPGESQAYADHQQMIQELQARKEARQQHRLEKQILGQETKDGFEKFFQARKDAYTQLRKK